jgi:superfamily I DNA/RNA helicase
MSSSSPIQTIQQIMQSASLANLYIALGPPGAGKTHSLTDWLGEQARLFGPSAVAACSFTRAAALELAGRNSLLPERNIGTLHSFCYHALDRPELVLKHIKEWNDNFDHFRLSGGSKDPNSPHDDRKDEDDKKYPGDKFLDELEICRARRLPRERWSAHLTAFAARWADWKKQCNYLDFTDLLEVCLRDLDAMPGSPAVLCLDEAQDSSRLQIDLILKWAQHMQKVVLAADEDQALYQWCGADPEVLIQLARALPPDHLTTLRRSYRLPRAVYGWAERWISGCRDRLTKAYSPRDTDGFVHACNATIRSPKAIVREVERLIADGKTVMILTTCGYMLSGTLKALKHAGVPFHNPYRPARLDWSPLGLGDPKCTTMCNRFLAFMKMCPEIGGAGSALWTRHELWAWAHPVVADIRLQRGGKKTLAEFKGDHAETAFAELAAIFKPAALDRLDTLKFNTRRQCAEAARWWLSGLPLKDRRRALYPARVFNERGRDGLFETPRCVVGTGHSVKGGEADYVFAFPDLSLAASLDWRGGNPDAIRRLFYVMGTRAREGLYLCKPSTGLHVRLT